MVKSNLYKFIINNHTISEWSMSNNHTISEWSMSNNHTISEWSMSSVIQEKFEASKGKL
jgi:hypothetical protein